MMKFLGAASAMVLLAACTTTGNVERGAATGAVLGGIAGGVIGNNVGDGDAGRGAAIGAAIGGTAGAARGVQQDRNMGENTQLKKPAEGETLYFDRQAGRYYYCEQGTGKSYWRNGELRSTYGC